MISEESFVFMSYHDPISSNHFNSVIQDSLKDSGIEPRETIVVSLGDRCYKKGIYFLQHPLTKELGIGVVDSGLEIIRYGNASIFYYGNKGIVYSTIVSKLPPAIEVNAPSDYVTKEFFSILVNASRTSIS